MMMARVLVRHRELAWELAKRDVTERYAGHWLGPLWAFVPTLLYVATYLFVFRHVLKVEVSAGSEAAGGDYAVYLLAGLLPWLAFYEAMTRSAAAVTTHAALVRQVVFPVELLPIKTLLAPLAMLMMALAVLTGYVTVRHGAPSATWLLVPVLVTVQFVGMAGAGYALAAVGVYFRDVRDLLLVLGMVGPLIAPIFYAVDAVPPFARPLLFVNPFSHLVWCYQDAMFYGHILHPSSWVLFPILSVIALIVGWRTFRFGKAWFGNVL